MTRAWPRIKNNLPDQIHYELLVRSMDIMFHLEIRTIEAREARYNVPSALSGWRRKSFGRYRGRTT